MLSIHETVKSQSGFVKDALAVKYVLKEEFASRRLHCIHGILKSQLQQHFPTTVACSCTGTVVVLQC